MNKKIGVFALGICLSGASMAQAPQLRADNIDEIIAAMTLEEKAQLLTGCGNAGFPGSGAAMGHQTKLVAGAAGVTAGIPRLGIPQTVVADGPAGVHIDAYRKGTNQTFFATGFPIGTCLASTWNLDLVEKVGKAIGNETLEYGCDAILGPGMNLHRNPLCGRNFEYYSEDPIVTGLIGAAMVKGIQSQGVGVSAKHFAVNSQESDRTRVDERVSQRALRELYLKGFEIMVRKSAPWTLMSSYNRINGVYSQGNYDLLTKVLRQDWGFKGIVMTDWIGERADLPISDVVIAGNDLLMPGFPTQVNHIIEGVKSGKIDIKDVDRNVRNMLEYIVKTPRFKGYKFSNTPNLKAHAAITRQSSTEGMVLLKNGKLNGQHILPMKQMSKVALFGVNSYDFMSGGLGSGCVNVPYVVDMVQGLKNAGISTTAQLTDIYEKYVAYAKSKLKADKNPEMWFLDQGQPKLDEIEISRRCVEHEVSEAQAAIITIGRQAGEGLDRKIEGEFNLSAQEKDMISNVSAVFHNQGKPVIVVINSGSVMETASWRDLVDAILVAWQPGEEGGNSVVDVLTGKANPSGRLTMTWPIAAVDHPSTANFPQQPDYYNLTEKLYANNLAGVNYTNHDEDIYVGYRYFDAFDKPVAYPFGYGLSYTTFSMSNFAVKQIKDKVQVKVTVKNTGKTSGKQVAQIYVQAPKGNYEKPVKELKSFAKTQELAPGQSQILTMTIDRRDLTSFDEANSQWKGDAGEYVFMVGDNAAHMVGTAKLRLVEYTEKVSEAMKPQHTLNLLRRNK
ncbi:MAG: glycoside hydrolase family 3 C-terminal domain-containing protein [Prevotella sp.]|nr:glycoside hydrolase family 3 C-terminal domain-containing protein [Prevotella sp.]